MGPTRASNAPGHTAGTSPLPDHPRRHPGDDDVLWDRPGDDRTGPDHASPPDVCHDDGRAADPGPRTDRDHGPRAGLLADRRTGVVESVCPSSARHVDARPDQHVPLQVDEAEVAPRADVHVLVDDRARLREERTEADLSRAVAAGEGDAEEGPAQDDPG